jgi:hypothetical protein
MLDDAGSGKRSATGAYHDLWISYHSTTEHFKHEKYLFLAGRAVRTETSKPKTL